MNEEEKYLSSIRETINGKVKEQLFGKCCFKINNKAFVCFFKNEMFFKLKGNAHQETLSLNGAKLFDLSGKNRPMYAGSK